MKLRAYYITLHLQQILYTFLFLLHSTFAANVWWLYLDELWFLNYCYFTNILSQIKDFKLFRVSLRFDFYVFLETQTVVMVCPRVCVSGNFFQRTRATLVFLYGCFLFNTKTASVCVRTLYLNTTFEKKDYLCL